jgi:hypothetical protein
MTGDACTVLAGAIVMGTAEFVDVGCNVRARFGEYVLERAAASMGCRWESRWIDDILRGELISSPFRHAMVNDLGQ